jgi:3-dehydroquinate synthase
MLLDLRSHRLQTHVYFQELTAESLTNMVDKSCKKVIFIVDKKLKPTLEKKLGPKDHHYPWPVFYIWVEAGEALKSLASYEVLMKKLMDLRADRRTTLVAIGGGTVGDVVGYLAATYMRGLYWIGIPTTLLAQVDSSLGGKTGINLTEGKNLIGAFHHPMAILCDPKFTETLGMKEKISGLGEILKYGLIADKKFFKHVAKDMNAFLKGDLETIKHMVKHSLQIKAKFVKRDPYDLKGVREKLNFGHTFAHGLEAATHYEKFQHGEAVVWGMLFELHLSYECKLIDRALFTEVEHILHHLPLTPLPPLKTFPSMIEHMKKDKKNQSDKITFLVMKDWEKIETQEFDLTEHSKHRQLAFEIYERFI